MSTAERTYDHPRVAGMDGLRKRLAHHASGLDHPDDPRVHLLVAGGLGILAYMIWSRGMGCYSGDRWNRKMERMEEKMGRMRDKMERSVASDRPRAATTHSTSIAPRRCAGSKRSSANSTISSIGCASPRTRPSSTSSWRSGAIAPRPTSAAAELKSPAVCASGPLADEAGGPSLFFSSRGTRGLPDRPAA